ncbi:UdgX family uracil-DNA binding protein [Actinoallomurus sp. CA-150999]|uniref:UdgX family uracil-DNA binding protein n=1 Tax=Actinoallomurus sp. CA-150999 TaxID=3239887 RepID=UPI003D8CF832
MTRFEGAEHYVPAGADLDGLRRAVQDCHGCDLYEHATQAVLGSGGPAARVVLVGEQPGDQEDRQGAPFVGPAGRLLDKALSEAGIERGDAYVTNSVKHFRFSQSGPGKRRIHQTPDVTHISACKPWLTAELRIIDPEVIVVLGATAGKALLGPSFRVTKQRGQLITRPPLDDESATQNGFYVATIHPSAVLRADDRDAAYAGLVSDLKVAAEVLH